RKHEGPRHIGGLAHDFGVHQVADADAGPADGHRNHDAVEHPEVIELIAPAENEDRQQDANRGAVRSQPAFPDFEDVDGVVLVLIPIVEKDVAQPCAQHRTYHHVEGNNIDPIRPHALFFVDVREYERADNEAQGKQNAVPAQQQRPDFGDDGGNVPGN
nr:hypothetical protein [Tanacetum cinerariifolium]